MVGVAWPRLRGHVDFQGVCSRFLRGHGTPACDQDRSRIVRIIMAAFERILMLGLDGATWSVLDPMCQRGLMPNLQALRERSAHGTLRSTVPPMTAAAWATMQTGCDPAHHGIFDHRYFDAKQGLMRVNHSGRFRAPTLWQRLGQSGRSVVSLNFPGTYPAPRVPGIIVSGMDAPHLEAALSGAPAHFAGKLRRDVPRYTLNYQWKRVPQSLEELQANARATAEGFLGRAEGALLADRLAPDWSALMVQFQNLDPFQHRAWRYLNVDETGIDDPAWNNAAAEVLQGLDRAIGRLCELADRRQAAVLAVSDHGFGPCRGRVHVNRILLDAGIIRLPSLAGHLWRRTTQAADRLRLWAAKRKNPNARGASFHASIAAGFPFDWRSTQAFAPHQDTGAMVYICRSNNRFGRVPNTPRRIEEVRTEVHQALAEAKHPETAEPLFPEIVELAKQYDLDPAEHGFPDVIAVPDRHYWVRTKLSADPSWIVDDPSLPGTHRPEGIVALSAPGITPGRSLQADLRDVSPSVLSMFGAPLAPPLDGRPFSVLDPHTGPKPPRTDHGAPANPAPHAPNSPFNPEDEALVEQRLRDLGYLG